MNSAKLYQIGAAIFNAGLNAVVLGSECNVFCILQIIPDQPSDWASHHREQPVCFLFQNLHPGVFLCIKRDFTAFHIVHAIVADAADQLKVVLVVPHVKRVHLLAADQSQGGSGFQCVKIGILFLFRPGITHLFDPFTIVVLYLILELPSLLFHLLFLSPRQAGRTAI